MVWVKNMRLVAILILYIFHLNMKHGWDAIDPTSKRPAPASANTNLFPCFASDYFLYHSLVIRVCLIFFWSWKMPYIRASLVGGHPGT